MLGTFLCAMPIFEAAIVFGQLKDHQVHTVIDVEQIGSVNGELHWDRTSYLGPMDSRGPFYHYIPKMKVPRGMQIITAEESTYDLDGLIRVEFWDRVTWWATMLLVLLLNLWILWRYLVARFKRKRFVPPTPRSSSLATTPQRNRDEDQDDAAAKELAWRSDIRQARLSASAAVTVGALVADAGIGKWKALQRNLPDVVSRTPSRTKSMESARRTDRSTDRNTDRSARTHSVESEYSTHTSAAVATQSPISDPPKTVSWSMRTRQRKALPTSSQEAEGTNGRGTTIRRTSRLPSVFGMWGFTDASSIAEGDGLTIQRADPNAKSFLPQFHSLLRRNKGSKSVPKRSTATAGKLTSSPRRRSPT